MKTSENLRRAVSVEPASFAFQSPATDHNSDQLTAARAEFHSEIGYLTKRCQQLVKSAYRFAAKAHAGQSRRSGEPYITHPLAVARILAGMQADAYCLCAALLHDVIEDCGMDASRLQKEFGPLISQLVNGLSKLKPGKAQTRAEHHDQSLRKLLSAIIRDKRVVLIKLADRLHNTRTLRHLSRADQKRISRETLEIYAPLARRLSLYTFYRDLADASFAILYPLRYRVVEAQIQRNAKRAQVAQQSAKEQLSQVFDEANIRAEFRALPFSLYSFYDHWRNRDQRLQAMTQGARWLILVENPEDCYRALWKIHATFTPRQKDLRDFIALPKSNGYRSLHTQVSVAGKWSLLVIRDRQMDRTALAGTIQDLGKHSDRLPGDLRRIVKQPASANFVENVLDDLQVRRMVVFTSTGEHLELPGGATALDFAFAQDRQLGLNAVGCWVDGQRAMLSTPLHSGNRVQIETGDSSTAKPLWMHAATTHFARHEIRKVFAQHLSTDSRRLGTAMLSSCLEQLGRTLDDLTAEPDFADRLAAVQVEDLDSLLQLIGTGKRLAAPVAVVLAGTAKKESTTAVRNVISGAEGLPIQFALCCHPLPGDRIVGEIRQGQGFSVHRHPCHRMHIQTTSDSPPIPLEWSASPQGLFTTAVKLLTDNRLGVLANITTAISNRGLHIVNLETQPSEQSIYIELQVADRNSLMSLLRLLPTTPGVREAVRHAGNRPSAVRYRSSL